MSCLGWAERTRDGRRLIEAHTIDGGSPPLSIPCFVGAFPTRVTSLGGDAAKVLVSPPYTS
jgi:hypothetical protein